MNEVRTEAELNGSCANVEVVPPKKVITYSRRDQIVTAINRLNPKDQELLSQYKRLFAAPNNGKRRRAQASLSRRFMRRLSAFSLGEVTTVLLRENL